MQTPLNLRYPIILVHGLGMRDDIKFIKYWGKIPETLEENGVAVFLSNQMAFHTIEFNAELLRERILEILKETNSTKINIIAHSKGGIEARYMISRLDMANKVASLTTLATPHRGSSLANWVFEKAEEKNALKISEKVLKALAEWQGDASPEILPAFRQMTPEAMQEFNQRVPDAPQVYYQSYGGVINGKPYGMWNDFKRKIIEEREGPNDGVVSQKSFEWSNFRGIVTSASGQSVSHHEIIGLTNISDFDAPAFFVSIAEDLAERGL
jgi:triacylglycerol lipase